MDNKTKIAVAASAITSARSIYATGADLWERYEAKNNYTASVGEGEYAYDTLMSWLEGQTKTRKVKFRINRLGVFRHYDSDSASSVEIDGHRLKVTIRMPDTSRGISVIDYDDIADQMGKKIVFTSRTKAGIDALEKKLEHLLDEKVNEGKSASMNIVASYGGWETGRLPKRNLDSVFLPEGVKESLVTDMEKFFDNEDRFDAIGLPWHRGYLFYGPPGNGKSSLALAIANHFKLSVYNLSLSSVKNDRNLVEVISRIDEKSILLIEDIDVFGKSVTRDGEAKDAPTLAGLLNALDGVSTPHGLMTFMTTNHPDKLDPALIRPGRVDHRIELKAPVRSQINDMFKYVYNEPLGVTPRPFDSMAQLADVFKRNTTDPESARAEIKGE